MIKIFKKVKFKHNENRMKDEGDINKSLKSYDLKKNKNLAFLVEKRFFWMNEYIKEDDLGIELGAGAGFSKIFVNNKNFKICDFSSHEHLDYKNIDAENTKFDDNSFNYVIVANVIHHLSSPLKFFKEAHRILKKDGKLLIFDSHCTFFLQIVLILMRQEGFDFTKNVWNEELSTTNKDNLWDGNPAIPHLIFDDKKNFKQYLEPYFSLEKDEFAEFFIFLNSGGVTSKTFFIPLNFFFLKLIHKIDNFLVKLLPNFFALGRKIVLTKK